MLLSTWCRLRRSPDFRLAVVAVALAAAGCDSSRMPTAPGAIVPSATPTPGTTATYTVSGVVTAMTAAGLVLVADVLIEEGRSHEIARTDEHGTYSLSRVPAGTAELRATKDGYELSRSQISVSGDMRLDIRIVAFTTYTLSGMAFEMTPAGAIPIEGVHLYCDSCGSPVGHTFTDSDANGFYAFAWTGNGTHPVQVWKEGYVLRESTLVGGRIPAIYASVNGDTRRDIELVRQ